MSKTKVLAVSAVGLFLGLFPNTCEAGPLLDWLRGRPVVSQLNALRNNVIAARNNAFMAPNNAFMAPNNAFAPRTNAFRYNTFYRGPLGAPVPQNYAQMPGTCTTTCPKTCYQNVNRVVANYVPYTAFRTQWCRVPVTYYRPVASMNPQTGCVSTCMQPYTYYQMQARRVPYTTYQTVYRTVQQRVPYTVYETSYAAAGSPPCSSCGTQPATVNPSVPLGLNATSQFNVPANVVPKLDASEIKTDTTLQKPASEPPAPIVDPSSGHGEAKENDGTGEKTKSSSHIQPQLNAPVQPAPVVDDSNRTASLIRGKWNYSPVRDAGYVTSINGRRTLSSSQLSGFASEKVEPNEPAFRQSGWKSVNQ